MALMGAMQHHGDDDGDDAAAEHAVGGGAVVVHEHSIFAYVSPTALCGHIIGVVLCCLWPSHPLVLQ